MFLLGCLAFALFALSDLNDLRLHRRSLLFCFPSGAALLSVSLAFQLNRTGALVSAAGGRVLFWLLFAIFMALLLHALFFTFPVSAAYDSPGAVRPVCRRGQYALCRHPGVLWFSCAACCLWAGAGLPLLSAASYILLDILLAAFEDLVVFPVLLTGYDSYRRDTPFLFPTLRSMESALKSMRKSDRT